MRIIVLGGTRFTGPHIVRRLRERGDDVVVVHRGTNCDDVTHMHCDRRDVDIRGDLVIDLCCMTEAEARAAAAHFRNERYVVISSGDVYRNYDGLQRHYAGAPDPTPLAEDAPLRETLYPYRDKAAQLGEWVRDYDKILVERALAGDRTTVLRYPAVYGPHDEQRRFADWIAAIDRGEPIAMSPKRAAWRWTHGFVENVADAVVLATCDAAAGKTYNVGEPDAPTQSEFVQLLGGRVELRDDAPRQTNEPPLDWDFHLHTDTSRIRRELGYGERIARAEALSSLK